MINSSSIRYRWTDLKGTVLSLALIASSATQATAQNGEVNILFWGDYVPAETIDAFEAETGIDVVYGTFDTLEVLETKILSGNSGYDVVLPSALVANRLMQAGGLLPLDKSKLSNLRNLDPKVMEFLERHDPDNQFGVPYLWGTTGVIYNPAMVLERMPDAPLDSLAMFFDPAVVSKFADCGVAFIDSPEEVVAIALNYLGLDPFTKGKEDFEKVGELLAPILPHIRHFNTGSIITDMASGNLCLTLGWSGDAGTAYYRALEAENGVEVFYSVPKEGTEVFFDFMSIAHGAPNLENAHTFIDYLMRPEVMAGVTNLYYYPNGNAAALEHVLEEIRTDPNVYPTDEMMKSLFPNLPRDQKTQRILTRTWTRFKTGG
ncbi:MAG: polyamine ABC transporter substrate-binding protein [Paracoccaceae bacterium]|nr:polyamine ABC transporter substrate-binding protein [Paracoccaceae bacterium]